MSIRVMTAVWDRATDYAKGELLVLLALADWANDEGRCHPSVPRIANKSRLTERQTYNVLKRLQADGVITVERGGGRGKLTVYQIHAEHFGARTTPRTKTCPQGPREARRRAAIPEINSVKLEAPTQPENHEIGDTETLKSATGNPEISYIPPHPPLGRTVKEPSQGTVKKQTHPVVPPASGTGRDVRNDSPGDADLDAATEKLACECDVSDERQRKKLSKAIAQYAQKENLSQDESAALMIGAWREYREAMPLLRYRWGPVKFFTLGHWRNPDGWPWDQQLLDRERVARQARVGMVQ